MEIKNVPSIGVKSLGYTAKAIRQVVEAAPGEKIFLARVGGVAAQYFTGESKNGEWVGFRGMFSALSKDNTAQRSTVCYLPANLARQVRENIDKNGEANFTADVFVTESTKNASGYAYMVEPVMSDEAQTKMASISDSVFKAVLPQLESKTEKAPVKK